jgi:uncharacterized protein YndB with AHSA1/START domain
MQLWLFKCPTNKIVRIDQTLTVGGRYSICEKADGREIDHYGEYTAIDPPHRLAFWLEVPVHFEGRTHIVDTLQTTKEGCEINLNQTRVDASVVEKNWRTMFQNLAGVLLRM